MNRNNTRNENPRTWLIVTALIVIAIVGFLVALWATSVFLHPPSPFVQHGVPPPGYRPFEDIELFYTIETVFSTINVMLSILLLAVYTSIYRKTRSEFTIGLIIFSAVFLLNALASNPLIRAAFGYRTFGLGPFTMLPDLFTFAALIVLLYLSAKY
jgi:hypothetical protein